MANTQKEFNKDYLAEKLQAVGNKLGDAYGEPLMNELITRMERTVAHFNEEVDVMVNILKSRTINQRGLLASMRGENLIAESVELSDLERKLESEDVPLSKRKTKEERSDLRTSQIQKLAKNLISSE